MKFGHIAVEGWVLLFVILTAFAPALADVSYIYDRFGRLVAVIDPATDTAVYSYDGVGNLLSISRYPSSTVSVIDFTPSSGPVGTPVNISGTGFSPIAGQNTVTFNGTAATVVSSTATQIVTSVPAGATTGPIAVTVSAGSATSSGSFVVTGLTAPTITSFTPSVGVPGTAVNVAGTNFESVATNNRLTFNIARGAVGSATATTLGATVPNGATSGHLTVATPAGVSVSSDDFFVPPPGYTTAQVVFTGRMMVNGSNLTASITPTGKIGLIVFDGTAGQQASLGVVQVNNYDCTVTIFRPDGATVLSQFIGYGAPRRDLHIAGLPVTGTYTIFIGAAGPDTFTLTLSEDLPPVSITVGGTSATLNITRRAQRTPLTFTGTAGQRLSLGFTSAGFASYITVLNPGGSVLQPSAGVGYPTASLDLPVLSTTGTYTIFVDPSNAATGSITVTLSEEISGAITIGGAAVPVSITRPGQRARLTFSATAGQRLDLGLTGSSISSGTTSILNPDGSTLTSVSFGTANTALDTPPLPVTGTYSVLVDPAGYSSAYTGNITLTLSEELAGPITPGGSPVSVSITPAGQRARLSFSGTAGHRVSVNTLPYTITESILSIIKPDGSTLGSTTINTYGSFLDPLTLPTTGTYAVLVDPTYAYTGNMTVTLYDVPADLTGSLTVNGPAVNVNLTVPGQQAFLTFPATAGQAITVHGANSTIGCTNIYLTWPNGTTSSGTPCTATFWMSNTASQNGTYTFRVDPKSANAGSVDVSVTSP